MPKSNQPPKPMCGICHFKEWLKEQKIPNVLHDHCRSTFKNSILSTYSEDFLSKMEWESSDDGELEEADSSDSEEGTDNEEGDEGEESSDEEESIGNEEEEEQE